MVDCDGLENRWPLTGPGGSNPSLSAKEYNRDLHMILCMAKNVVKRIKQIRVLD